MVVGSLGEKEALDQAILGSNPNSVTHRKQDRSQSLHLLEPWLCAASTHMAGPP